MFNQARIEQAIRAAAEERSDEESDKEDVAAPKSPKSKPNPNKRAAKVAVRQSPRKMKKHEQIQSPTSVYLSHVAAQEDADDEAIEVVQKQKNFYKTAKPEAKKHKLKRKIYDTDSDY